jgi:hypothetical protein
MSDNTQEFYFKAHRAMSYTGRGPSGQSYEFFKKKVTKVSRRDAVHFRAVNVLIECKANGDLVDPIPTPRPKPLSYTKFTPESANRRTTHNVPTR